MVRRETFRIIVRAYKGWIDARADDQREFRERTGRRPARRFRARAVKR